MGPVRAVPFHPLAGWLWALLAAVWLSACGDPVPAITPLAKNDVILAFGDSLTHGTGADAAQAYPAQLESLIERAVVNAGVPGETTAEGVERLPEALATHRPRLLLLCLGGNDMLRRMNPALTADNLRAMIRMAKDEGIGVVLIGVPEPGLLAGPPVYFRDIAAEYGVPYEGEAFEEVLRNASLKSDPIHANGAGYRVVAEAVAALLREAGATEK